ncbi:MAG: hypothetical protein CL666_08715 [Balneola sp.]|nr:hypothetical protein [Balneola sp.]|tara:strand:+ start:12483 stop:12650 length:168 start_codon:yes stop_codon:yes gene_type:complete
MPNKEQDIPQVIENFQYPVAWQEKLTKIAKEKGASRAQIIRDAIHEKYIKGEKNE